MNVNKKIKFFIFIVCVIFCSGKCFAQRAAGESTIVSGAKNVARAAAPIVKHAYKRVESNSRVVKGIENIAGQAVPLVEKAAPIVRKGFIIGKKIFKILKKILR